MRKLQKITGSYFFAAWSTIVTKALKEAPDEENNTARYKRSYSEVPPQLFPQCFVCLFHLTFLVLEPELLLGLLTGEVDAAAELGAVQRL